MAVVFYGIVLLMMVLMLIVLGRHAERAGLFGDDLADERKEAARVKYQLMPSLIAYVVAAFLGFFVPQVGVSIYLIIADMAGLRRGRCAGCRPLRLTATPAPCIASP